MNKGHAKRICILTNKPDSFSTAAIISSLTKKFSKPARAPKVQIAQDVLVEAASPLCDFKYFDFSKTLFWPRIGDWEFEYCIQRLIQLETLHPEIKWLNKPSAVALAKNKLATQLKLQSEFAFPKLYLKQNISFPLVAKVPTSSQGRGVFLVQDSKEVQDLELQFGPMIKQEFIEDTDHADFRVLVLGNEVLGVMKRRNQNDFRKNISTGATGEPAHLSEQILNQCIQASNQLGLDFSGVDLIISKKQGPLLLEVNGTCGLQGFQKFVDPDVFEKISSWISEMTFLR